MSDEFQQILTKMERLELLISFLIMNEAAKGDPKFIQTLKVLIKEQPEGYFDDLWDKYKLHISEDSSKLSQIEILNERINLVDKLFNELKNSTDKLSPEQNNG